MTMFTKIFASAAGIAALATAAPAAAQYYSYAPRYASPYGAPYGNAYGYNANVTNMAAQQCAAAVQSRLNRSVGMTGILGAVLGARQPSGRVLQVTQVSPNRRSMTVRGLATSGRAYAYSPYGYGAYVALGYSYQPDLSFRCSVDYRGYIRDVDVYRR